MSVTHAAVTSARSANRTLFTWVVELIRSAKSVVGTPYLRAGPPGTKQRMRLERLFTGTHALLHWGPNLCFAQDDLYTTRWGSISNTDIEQFFFGKLDGDAPAAVDYFARLTPRSADGDAFNTFLKYMSIQKLRTPKGLAWLRSITRSLHPNYTLQQLQKLQSLFCATWADCIWQIADARGPRKVLCFLVLWRDIQKNTLLFSLSSERNIALLTRISSYTAAPRMASSSLTSPWRVSSLSSRIDRWLAVVGR